MILFQEVKKNTKRPLKVTYRNQYNLTCICDKKYFLILYEQTMAERSLDSIVCISLDVIPTYETLVKSNAHTNTV